MKAFKNPKKNEQFVISSIQEGSNDYVDIMRGQSGNSVGSLKKTQRIVFNSKRKNFLSMGKLKDSSVLSISSTRGRDMKLYRLNSETEVCNSIINLLFCGPKICYKLKLACVPRPLSHGTEFSNFIPCDLDVLSFLNDEQSGTGF